MAAPESETPAVYRRADLARVLNVCVTTVDNLRKREIIPEPAISSGRLRLWSRDQVAKLLQPSG